LAEKLAKKWMPGTRIKSDRPAWAHPEDVVRLIEKSPLTGHPRELAIQIAWLHDIIEDGKTEDGKPVTRCVLREAGVDRLIVEDVGWLSKRDGQPRWEYYYGIAERATGLGVVVKVLDRAVNLKEGAETFGRGWWHRYRRDARLDVLPLVKYVGDPLLRKWLREELEKAMAKRR